MKILHTADWHLGKRLDRFDRGDEQQAVMEEICEIAEREKVDAVIIAGDLYDTFNPPTEATETFYKTVKRLSNNGLRPVVAIAGNHDSADRIEAPDPLARECGIILAGYPYSEVPKFQLESGLEITRTEPGFIELKLPRIRKKKQVAAQTAPAINTGGQTTLFSAPSSGTPITAPVSSSQQDSLLRILLTPYASESRLKENLDIKDQESELRQVLESHWQNLAERYCDDQGVNLLMAHLFMIHEGQEPPQEPDDEKPILHVGGAQAVFTQNLPSQIQYVALGHLHRYQKIKHRDCPVIYSGSPLEYSFAEAGQKKYVVILEVEPGGVPATYTEIELKRGKPLLRETFEDVEEAAEWLGQHQEAIVELFLKTDSYIRAEDRKRLHQSHPKLIGPLPVFSDEQELPDMQLTNFDRTEKIETLFARYFEFRKKEPPNEDLMALFMEVIGKEDVPE